jgi:hypothetical protein
VVPHLLPHRSIGQTFHLVFIDVVVVVFKAALVDAHLAPYAAFFISFHYEFSL